MTSPRARQILEKLVITEISGVDRPCQEHARMTIMKRDTRPDLTALQKRVDVLKASTANLEKFWSVAARIAAVAARRAAARGAAAVSRRGRKVIGRKLGHALLSEAKSAARGAVRSAAISGAVAGATAAHARAMSILEARQKEKEKRHKS